MKTLTLNTKNMLLDKVNKVFFADVSKFKAKEKYNNSFILVKSQRTCIILKFIRTSMDETNNIMIYAPEEKWLDKFPKLNGYTVKIQY